MPLKEKNNMSLLRKLLGVLCLIILFSTIYFMFSSDHSNDVFMKREKTLRTIRKFNLNMSNPREGSLLKKVKSYIESKDPDNLKSYVVDELMFGNIKEIERVTRKELRELEKLGIKPEKSDYHIAAKRTKIVKIEKKVEKENNNKEKNSVKIAKPTSNKVKKFDNHNKIKMKYKYRNPRKKDLMKLSKEQLDIEAVTDPLPSSAACNTQTFLTVLVVSTPVNFLRRQFIRDTWGYSYMEDVRLYKKAKSMTGNEKSIPLKNMFRTVFVLGQMKQGTHMKEVYEEARLNKDIIFGSLHEDYKNLTMKTRLALKWAFYDCDSIYIVKTDDDVFMNPVMIVEWLKDMPRNNFYTGWCNFGSSVVRDPNNKWYVSREDFAPNNYPGYCLGGGYLMSNDVLGKVIGMSYGRKLFPMEDLYVGLMIDEMPDVKIQDEKKHFDLVYNGRSNDCELNDLFLAHQVYGQSLVGHIKRARNAMTSCP